MRSPKLININIKAREHETPQVGGAATVVRIKATPMHVVPRSHLYLRYEPFKISDLPSDELSPDTPG